VPSKEPEAELWIGAHPTAPSSIAGTDQTLLDLISKDPAKALGTYDRLPFLLKVLAVDAPLSLQVHPDADQARQGYEREERGGKPPGDPARSYHDDQPKPELICALTRFEALAGFRDPRESATILEALGITRLQTVTNALHQNDLKAAVNTLLDWPEVDRPKVIGEIEEACGQHGAPEYHNAADLAERYQGDMGVAIALLLNLVVLEPGQALFVPPRMPHAYLHGTGVEIMAGSDNVLRGGLTPKHVDIPELLAVTDFTAGRPRSQAPDADGTYAAPTDRFALSRHELDGTQTVTVDEPGPGAVLCLKGEITVTRADTLTRLRKGESVFVPYAGGPVTLRGDGLAFRAAPGRPD
jgi:mannose-6-phosphate isomerase